MVALPVRTSLKGMPLKAMLQVRISFYNAETIDRDCIETEQLAQIEQVHLMWWQNLTRCAIAYDADVIGEWMCFVCLLIAKDLSQGLSPGAYDRISSIYKTEVQERWVLESAQRHQYEELVSMAVALEASHTSIQTIT
jgi:hypothetical protein